MKKTEEKKTKQKNWFKECFLERRFFVLVLGALLGIALFLFVKEYDLLSKVFFYSEETTENIEKKRFITNLLPVILGLPIILFLWVFRTHDTKEQLDKAQTNIEQQDFHDALRMLADDKLVSQEIAVLRLIDISKKNKIYDDTIKLAFIKRMKAPYKIRRYFFGRELGAFETKVLLFYHKRKKSISNYFAIKFFIFTI